MHLCTGVNMCMIPKHGNSAFKKYIMQVFMPMHKSNSVYPSMAGCTSHLQLTGWGETPGFYTRADVKPQTVQAYKALNREK